MQQLINSWQSTAGSIDLLEQSCSPPVTVGKPMGGRFICPAKPRILLRVGISLVALSLAVPSLAADLVVTTPAPIVDPGEWRAFVEGGTFWTAGDPIPYTVRGFGILGAAPIFTGSCGNGSNASLRPRAGWDAAVGLSTTAFRHALARQYASPRAVRRRRSAAIGAPCQRGELPTRGLL